MVCMTLLSSTTSFIRRSIHTMAMYKRPSSSSSKSSTQKQSTDPWKILVKKLGNERVKIGSVGKTLKESTTVDELKCKHFDTCSGCSMKGTASNESSSNLISLLS